MKNFTNEELTHAHEVVISTISNCENMHGKFNVGSSQHTLLSNRIKALHISKVLILKELSKLEESVIECYTKEEITKALEPIDSIIRKCEKLRKNMKQETDIIPD